MARPAWPPEEIILQAPAPPEANDQTRPVVLVDGTYHLFRSYHALPPLRSKDGEPTWATLGCLNIIDKLIRQHQPEILVVVFDAAGGSFRNELLPEYKQNRPDAPEDLLSQLNLAKQIIPMRGITMICEKQVEADDVIASLIRQARDAGLSVVISTNDKDLMQLVDATVTVEDHKGTMYDPEGVEKKFAVPPSAIVDYLCLTGDQSDNVPGVDKVGPKTAANWLQKYGSLQSIIDAAGEIKGKVGENLRQAIPRMHLNQKLIRLKDDVQLPPLASMRMATADVAKLREIYSQLGFRALEGKLPKEEAIADGDLLADIEEADPEVGSGQSAAGTARVTLVKDVDALKELVAKLQQSAQFAIYPLGSNSNARNVQVLGIAFAAGADADPDENGWISYIPLKQHRLEDQQQLSASVVCEHIASILRDGSIKKITWDLKLLLHFFAQNSQDGDECPKNCEDVLLQAYLLAGGGAPHSLAKLASKLPAPIPQELSSLCGTGRNKQKLEDLPISLLATQGHSCAVACMRLYHQYSQQFAQADMPRLKKIYHDMDLPLVAPLATMERNGVRLDYARLKQQSADLANRLQQIKADAEKIVGNSFNLDSPTQIRQILFDDLKLPVLRKTPQGKPSTAEDVLEDLKAEGLSPLPEIILQYRSLSKLKSTYTDSLPNEINRDSGRVHTSYYQAAVATGRLASANPNLQNIPARSPEGRKIRSAFVADPGHKLMAADYAQIELRIMAHLSSDPALLDAFHNDRDVHSETARGIFKLAASKEPDREQRRMAKIINFGLIYGMSAFSLGRRLKIQHSEAEQYVSNYFARYPKVHDFMDNCREVVKKQGYVETICGRRVVLPAIHSRQATERNYAERAAINAPMQGTAADIIRRAMIQVDRWINETQPRVRMIMQVHDELVLEVPDDLLEQSQEAVQQCMTTVCPEIDIPLEVSISFADDWEQAH